MKRSAPLTLIVLSLLFIPLGRNSYGAEENAGILLGKSRTEITPPVGTPLSGYGKRKGKPSSGVHDSLYARTIILSHQNERFVFTSVDLVLVDEELRMAVLKKIRKSLELEDRQFVLMATHNHSGAGAIGGRFWERFIMGKKNKAVYEGITDAIAKSVLEASNRPTPVLAELGTADISRWVENRMDGKDNRLKHLKVLRFQNDSKQTAAYMLFMAAHPTILPASNFEFSGDYPGRFCSLLEDKNPDSVALFVNGAAGDLRPRLEGYENRFDKMEAYASTLANAVNSISFKPIELTGVWASALERKKLPWTKIGRFPLQVPVIISNRVFPRKSYFQVFRMGRAAFVTFPGELASETGTSIERRLMAKSFEPFLIGFANDYIGYVIPRRHYLHHDHYESRASFYGPKMDRFTEKTLDAIITHLLSPHEREVLNPEGRLLKTSKIPVLKLHGDPYHRGYEEGRLLKSEIQQGVRDIFAYFRSELKIPGLNRLIINAILDRAWKKMAPYVSYDEYEQMRGLADGSGVSFKIVKRIHALPEVYPTFCANSAFWGPATKDGRLIAIRNLDWNKKMGIHRHAAVKIHHMFGQATAVNIGYYGFIGVLSGLNEHGISVGQIGATSSDETMKGE